MDFSKYYFGYILYSLAFLLLIIPIYKGHLGKHNKELKDKYNKKREAKDGHDNNKREDKTNYRT